MEEQIVSQFLNELHLITSGQIRPPVRANQDRPDPIKFERKFFLVNDRGEVIIELKKTCFFNPVKSENDDFVKRESVTVALSIIIYKKIETYFLKELERLSFYTFKFHIAKHFSFFLPKEVDKICVTPSEKEIRILHFRTQIREEVNYQQEIHTILNTNDHRLLGLLFGKPGLTQLDALSTIPRLSLNDFVPFGPGGNQATLIGDKESNHLILNRKTTSLYFRNEDLLIFDSLIDNYLLSKNFRSVFGTVEFFVVLAAVGLWISYRLENTNFPISIDFE